MAHSPLPALDDDDTEIEPHPTIGIKGCNCLYQPGRRAFEYAALTASPYKGCGHKCRYCYVPGMTHVTRESFDAGASDRQAFRSGIVKELMKYRNRGISEQVLMSFSADVYHPFDTSLTRETYELLIYFGFSFTPLSKGGTLALRDIDLFRPDRDAYGVSLISMDERFTRKWEAASALPADRLKALQIFFEHGIWPWLSLEPILSIEEAVRVIRETRRWVQHYKFGKPNYLKGYANQDWATGVPRICDEINKFDRTGYCKEDLQQFLPKGWDNRMRRPQHY